MAAGASTFYPPRAGHYSRALVQLARLRYGVVFVLEVLVPGLAFLLHRRRVAGLLVGGAWGAAMLVFWVRMGTNAGALAGLALPMLHALSVNEALAPLVPRRRRLLPGVAAALFAFVAYGSFDRHFVTSMVQVVEAGGQRVLVAPGVEPGALRIGQWVAYQLPTHGVLMLEQVLALPGAEVRFADGGYWVGESFHPCAFRGFPKTGSLRVPEGAFFIWPTRRFITQARAYTTQGLLPLSLVPKEALRGCIYESWFGRPQHGANAD